MPRPTLERVVGAYGKLGYRIFDGLDPQGNFRDLDLNIFGVRSKSEKPDRFDDWIGAFWREQAEGAWIFHTWPATTDPGLFYLRQPQNIAGTAVLVEGQYRGSHRIGLHKGKYVALVQNAPVKVYRDRDRDDVIDVVPDSIQVGQFGINIHRASAFQASTVVANWSAGCQVFSDPGNFALFMDICTASAGIWSPTFSYTLLTEKQLNAR